MGIFSKKPKIARCEMCGKSDLEGCGAADKHVVQISAEGPAWLPIGYRAQAPGEYTWLCVRCNAFPAMKWPGDGGASAGLQLHLGRAHHVGMFASGGTPVSFSMMPAQPAAPEEALTPEAAPSAAAVASAEVTPATPEEEMIKGMAYSLAAMCKDAVRLYDQCIEKADESERARAMSQTDYVNGVQQHPISKQAFAGLASRLEAEFTGGLQELHELWVKGESAWNDFVFMAGGSDASFATAMSWCAQHGIDSDTVSTIAVQGLFLRCDFGLTRKSFLEENDRLNAVLESSQQ